MKIWPVGVGLLHADGRTERHDEINSRFSQFGESAQKKKALLVVPSTKKKHITINLLPVTGYLTVTKSIDSALLFPFFSLEPQQSFMKQTHRNPFRQCSLFLLMQC